jgi:hypothetical protein
MELPRALMPWRTDLDLFPHELALALGPLIQRLDLAIGPLRLPARQGEGDPDGFHGIARRGSYERLLISEWLLAEEFPEEFARRAAMGEHGFLELARRQPAGARTSVALFDAGPDQLGAPRIAHLAALIVLARRAEAGGVCFRWGILQQSADDEMHASLTAGTIMKLLRARSLRQANDDQVAAWRERASSEIGADDIWIVGGERLDAMPAARGASLLRVADPYLPDVRQLNATVTDRGRVRPTVTLELPSDRICARLLRNPFAGRRAAPTGGTGGSAPITHLAFAPGGRKLLARSNANRILVYAVPNSPHAGAGKPKTYQTTPPYPVLAAGRAGPRLALVTATDRPEVLRIECVGRRSVTWEPIEFLRPEDVPISPVEASTPLGRCCFLETPPDDPHRPYCLILVENRLLRLHYDVKPEVDLLAASILDMEDVLAATLSTTGYAVIGKQSGVSSRWQYLAVNHHYQGGVKVLREFEQVLSAHSGYHGSRTEPVEGLFAVEQTAGHWTIMMQPGDMNMVIDQATRRRRQPGDLLLNTLPEDQVIGVIALAEEKLVGSAAIGFRFDTKVEDNEARLRPGLIILKPDRRTIIVMGDNWVRNVRPASSDIVAFAANPYGPEIAYLTAHGTLVVYSLAQQMELCRWQTEAGS